MRPSHEWGIKRIPPKPPKPPRGQRFNAWKKRVRAKINAAKINRQNKFLTNMERRTARVNAKTEYHKGQTAFRRALLEERAKTAGGPIGDIARGRMKKIARNESEIELLKQKPALNKEAVQAKIKTEAEVKKTRAKGAAAATVASALGGAYATGKDSEARKAEAQAKSDIATTEAIQASVNSVPTVTTDPYSDRSVSGLTTGVR